MPETSLLQKMLNLLLTLAAVYGAVLAYLWFFGDTLVYFPPPSSYRDDQHILKISARDGTRLSAIYLPNPQARFTVLFTHGNAEDIGHNDSFLQALHDAGFAVLAWDYRGYGTSEGRPSEATFYSDSEDVYDYLTRELRVAPERVLLLGRSLGGASAVHVASARPVAGLVLESTFVSGRRMLARHPIFPIDRYRSIDRLRHVRCPVFVIHGTKDSTIPFEHGQTLFETANPPKRSWWVEGAGHNDLFFVAGAEYFRRLRDFAASLCT
ncbi:MAG TPA: alpha/beta hydrolase [Terriglobales bacterium]|nr:alpha/beta hydrolase [Terriglobales bacterium]